MKIRIRKRGISDDDERERKDGGWMRNEYRREGERRRKGEGKGGGG